MASTMTRKNFSLGAAIAMCPSAVAKNWNGTTLGWADIARRSVTNPLERNQVAG
jgi:hypothetical protein